MKRKDPRIIDAEELLGKSGFKIPEGQVLADGSEEGTSCLPPLPGPSEIERRAERFLAKGLEAVK